MTRTRFYN